MAPPPDAPRRRASSTDPEATIELFSDARFSYCRTSWFGDLRFAFKSYAYGGLFGRPRPFPDMLQGGARLVQAVEEAEACDDESSPNHQPATGTAATAAEKFSVTGILTRMAARPTMVAIRFLGWALSKLFRSGFTSVHVHNAQVVAQTVHRVQLANQSPGGKKTALILLPTHRSHADYLLLSFIFFGLDLPVPTIAAGDNLNVPLLGWLLSSAGAFFIRRALQSPRYRLVMQGYLFLLCKSGVPIEFFIEGGRSRRGCVGRPKVGLLSMIIQMIRDGDLHDALLVPLSIDYDQVPEGNGFANEVLGTGKKQQESLFGTVRALVEWMLWGKRGGAVYVGFADAALSVRELIHLPNSNDHHSHAHAHQHPHAGPLGGTIFRGGSTATLVLSQDNALAHEVGRVVVDAQRDCALVGSGALAACAMLMTSKPDLVEIQRRAVEVKQLLVGLGHGNRIPPQESDFTETVANLQRGASSAASSRTNRICLRYAAAPVVVRLLPSCTLALEGDERMLGWLSGMYDIEVPLPLAAASSTTTSPSLQQALIRLIAPMVLILDSALQCVGDRAAWHVGETKSEADLVTLVISKLARVTDLAELSAPLEISAAFRACVIRGVLKRTNIRRGRDTLAAYTLAPTSAGELELATTALRRAKQLVLRQGII